jgi:hypothetical protein
MTREIALTPEFVASLTVGEIEAVEERTGRPVTALFGEDVPRGATLHALAHAYLTREAKAAGDPLPTWEETGDVRVVVEEATGTTHPTPAARRRRE